MKTHGSCLQEERQEMLDAGCNGFLAKPFTAEQIYELLETLLPLRAEFGAGLARHTERFDYTGILDILKRSHLI